ncbi:hypothetical protein FLJC2902T_17360 [Flavobacterium limnosediminis JC2902]|uniref:Uncharacterized protein n=1 Tax=Flavobacterium limnosediminis JC2902 TaxID=1341181 RepID=V6SNW0_9FLAO|nr:hypothetical protein [Flavobacterium limnosediminis]ESU28383.1 hypothetical protein FLJC2902T_17360 [Flavobacterium limnosediminis JC2902]
MNKITLKKVQEKEMQVLQAELFKFHQIAESKYRNTTQSMMEFLEAIIEIDVAFRLWYLFRTKIESTNTKGSTLSLKASEAAILLMCCMPIYGQNRTEYENHVLEKYKLVLDQQLKSL